MYGIIQTYDIKKLTHNTPSMTYNDNDLKRHYFNYKILQKEFHYIVINAQINIKNLRRNIYILIIIIL